MLCKGLEGNVIMNNLEKRILITNIQRFSLHDGPGIRTTVFLKGCSLCCPWCSNPENIVPSLQEYEKAGVKGVYGQWIEADELVQECLKDKGFYDGILPSFKWNINSIEQIELLPGGVTFSGGECLLQMKQLIPVCEKMHRNNVHIAVETCLFVPSLSLRFAIQHIDFFYVDVKILDEMMCKKIEHGSLRQYINNYETLICSGKPVIVRIPVIGGYTDNIENRKLVKKLLLRFQPLKVELIKEHNLGGSKYKSLGMDLDYRGINDELLELGIPIEICRI